MKKPTPLWLKGGLIGLAVCFLMYGFFVSTFLIAGAFRSPFAGNILGASLYTGHGYSLLSGFMVNTEPFCENVVPICTYWTADRGCVTQVMTPEESCRRKAELILFISRTLGLFVGYYLAGSIFGLLIHIIQKWQMRRANAIEAEQGETHRSIWNTKKTEVEWIEGLDNFFNIVAKEWFQILEWLLAIGVVKFFWEKSSHPFIAVILAISFLVFWFYLQSFIIRIKLIQFIPEYLTRKRSTAQIIAFVIAAILVFVCNIALGSIVDSVSKY
ncbi:hypothetical protein IT087_04285 [Candidatus Uhrbacteria bacterium]|nr:hypothetical protein [Candidatus Uhrbacteria bacterium]